MKRLALGPRTFFFERRRFFHPRRPQYKEFIYFLMILAGGGSIFLLTMFYQFFWRLDSIQQRTWHIPFELSTSGEVYSGQVILAGHEWGMSSLINPHYFNLWISNKSPEPGCGRVEIILPSYLELVGVWEGDYCGVRDSSMESRIYSIGFPCLGEGEITKITFSIRHKNPDEWKARMVPWSLTDNEPFGLPSRFNPKRNTNGYPAEILVVVEDLFPPPPDDSIPIFSWDFTVKIIPGDSSLSIETREICMYFGASKSKISDVVRNPSGPLLPPRSLLQVYYVYFLHELEEDGTLRVDDDTVFK